MASTTTTAHTEPRWLWWRRFRYMMQLDEDENDQEYLQMIEYKHIHLPSLYFPFAVIILAVVALVYDEISDGTITLYFNSQAYGIKSISYQCGWEKMQEEYEMTNGLESTEDLYYRKTACEEEVGSSIENFCSDMERVGKVWLAFGILGIIFAAGALGVAFRIGKDSKILGALLLFCWVFLSIGVGVWNDGERCEDIESWASEVASFDTHIGVSIALMYAAIAHAVLGFVLWCYFMTVLYIKSQTNRAPGQVEVPEAQVTVGQQAVSS